MNWNKKIAIGLSLSLEEYEYNQLFKWFGDYIKEIYFAPAINKEEFHIHDDIIEQMKHEEEMSVKTALILELAKTFNIRSNIVLNSVLDVNPVIVAEAREWCSKYGIEPNKATVIASLEPYVRKEFGNDIEIAYSYNNNIENSEFLDNMKEGEFDTIVIGNRSRRDIELMKKIKESGRQVELVVDNGCSPNCLWCSTRMSECCETIVEGNIRRYGLEYCIAEQSIFPFEVSEYYDKFQLVDLYKFSTRQYSDIWSFKHLLELFINGKEVNNMESAILTCSLVPMINHIELATNSKKLNVESYEEIKEIKKNIWNSKMK